jgi:hypothetical protein
VWCIHIYKNLEDTRTHAHTYIPKYSFTLRPIYTCIHIDIDDVERRLEDEEASRGDELIKSNISCFCAVE